MNAIRFLVFFFICEETLLAPALAILTFSPNRLYMAQDHVLSVIVSPYRSFKDTVLSDRSLIEGTPSHHGIRIPDVPP